MKQKYIPGQIVYCEFPSSDGSYIGKHYCIVVEDRGIMGLYVAFGTSKKIDSSPLKHEFVVSKDSDLKICGLKKPTRFSFKIFAMVPKGTAEVCGVIAESMAPDVRSAFNNALK